MKIQMTTNEDLKTFESNKWMIRSLKCWNVSTEAGFNQKS